MPAVVHPSAIVDDGAQLGEGTRVWDTDGKEYLDFVGGLAVNVLGHAHPVVAAAVAEQAEATRSSQSGVNLDEEAARLIQYQQGYQAAAKVLQAAQSILQALLDASGG